jgi:hypothetical protein
MRQSGAIGKDEGYSAGFLLEELLKAKRYVKDAHKEFKPWSRWIMRC